MELPDLIEDEARDAMKYAALAIDHKAAHPDLAELYMQLSGDELRHMKLLAEKLTGTVEAMHKQYSNA